MERKYTVYIHENQINGKKYIGITCDAVESRWRNGKGYSTQVFGRAIEKYGWDNFSHKIIQEGLSKEEAERLEIQLIKQYNTQNPDYGYNIAAGGGATLPSMYCEVFQYSSSGDLIGRYNSYKQAEKETGTRADEIGLVCNGTRYTANGFVWSNKKLSKDDVKEQIKQAQINLDIGRNNGITNAVKKISMKVQQIDPKSGKVVAEYPSQREAARTLNIDQKGISNVIRGKQKTSGGFIWKAI